MPISPDFRAETRPNKRFTIQVKQSESIGRNVVDNFETAIRRAKAQIGLIVAFSFAKGAYEEVARVKNHEGLEIRLVTIDELLKEDMENKKSLPAKELRNE